MPMQPHPLPFDIDLGEATMENGMKLLIMTLTTPAAKAFYFFEPEKAKHIGSQLALRGNDLAKENRNLQPTLLVPDNAGKLVVPGG